MGIKFYSTIHSILYSNGLDQTEIETPNSQVFAIKSKNLVFYLHNLYPVKNDFDQLIKKYKTDHKIIHIFEDQWLRNPLMMAYRIKNVLGLNQTIAARACELKKLDKPTTDSFFEENHFQGSSSYALKYGLFYKEELVAAMAFSKSRVMTDSVVLYRSYELIRFANKQGFTVSGGLQKLLKNFIKEKHAQHIMTYIDLDWGNGKAFANMGFKDMGNTSVHQFYVDPTTFKRHTEKEILTQKMPLENYIAIQNSGSKKMILDLRIH